MLIKIKEQTGHVAKCYLFNNYSLSLAVDTNLDSFSHTKYVCGIQVQFSENPNVLSKQNRILLNREISKKIRFIFSLRQEEKKVIAKKITQSMNKNISYYKINAQEVFNITQKEKLLSEFLNTLRHEISNPITGIKLALDFFSKKTSINNEIKKTCQEMIRCSDKIISLITPRSTNTGKCAIKIIENCLEQQKSTSSEIIFKSSLISTYKLEKHHEIFEAVVSNIIQNAKESCISKKEKWISVEAKDYQGKFILEISDSGDLPINPDMIFTPYYTTKKTGSGLGLFICKKYCKAIDLELGYTAAPIKKFTLKEI